MGIASLLPDDVASASATGEGAPDRMPDEPDRGAAGGPAGGIEGGAGPGGRHAGRQALAGDALAGDALAGDHWRRGLLPAEAALVAGAAPRRQRDFAAGRDCAREALRRLGAPAGAVLVGPAREPVWPAGVVGSITHCDGFAAAAAGWRAPSGAAGLAGIGIDAEPHAPLPPEVEALVATPDERRWLDARARAGDRVPWSRLLFSAKESIYKCLFPVHRVFLDFPDVAVQFGDPADGVGSFTAQVLSGESDGARADGPRLRGRFAVTPRHLLTAALLPAQPA